VISKYGIKTTRKRLAYLSENLGKRLSIDKRLFNGELYTILTNKAAKERKEHSSYDLKLKLRLS
jgi:hypothetical protein